MRRRYGKRRGKRGGKRKVYIKVSRGGIRL